jgi:hypothetical protein
VGRDVTDADETHRRLQQQLAVLRLDADLHLLAGGQELRDRVARLKVPLPVPHPKHITPFGGPTHPRGLTCERRTGF